MTVASAPVARGLRTRVTAADRLVGAVLFLAGAVGTGCTLLPLLTISAGDGLFDGVDKVGAFPAGLDRAFGISFEVGFYQVGMNWVGALALPVALIAFALIGIGHLLRPLSRRMLGGAGVLGAFTLFIVMVGAVRPPIQNISSDEATFSPNVSDAVSAAGPGLIVTTVMVAVAVCTAAAAALRTPPN